MLMPDMRLLQTGDQSMWDRAFLLLWPVAWSAAQRRLAKFAPAEVEDVAIGAIREVADEVRAAKVGSFDELMALTGVIASRRALDHIRRMRAQRRAAGKTETIEGRKELVSSAPSPLEQADAHDLAKLLMDLATNLSERQRQLLKAYYLDGLKQAELAERFGMNMGTVGVTLSRALKSLRNDLRKYPQLMKELLEARR